MKILDAQGRLFGKVSILDLVAGLMILLILVGVFRPSVAQVISTKPIEVDVVVRGLNVLKPEELRRQFQEEKKTNIIIRNQPYGQIDIKSVQPLPRNVVVPQPDGSVKALPDPRPEAFSIDMIMTLSGNAQITNNGPVLGNTKIKVGTPVELEGLEYDFNATVIDIRIKD